MNRQRRSDPPRAADPVGGTWPWAQGNATTRLRYILYALRREDGGVDADVDRLGEAVLQEIGKYWDPGASEGLVNGQSRDVRVATFYCASRLCSGHTRPLAARRVAQPAMGPAEEGWSLPDETLGVRVLGTGTDGRSSYFRPTGVRSTGGSTERRTEHRHREQCIAAGGGGFLPCEVEHPFRIDYDPEDDGWGWRRDMYSGPHPTYAANRAGLERMREEADLVPRVIQNTDRTCWLTEDHSQVLGAVSQGGYPGQACHYRPWEMLAESDAIFDQQEEGRWVDHVPSGDIERRRPVRLGQRVIVDEYPPEGCEEEYLLGWLGAPNYPAPGGSEDFVAQDMDQGGYYPRLELLQEDSADPSTDSWNGELTPRSYQQAALSDGEASRACRQAARLVGEGDSVPMPRVEVEFVEGLDFPHKSPNYYRNHPQEVPCGEEERAAQAYDPRDIPLMDRVRRGREDDYHVVHPHWYDEVLAEVLADETKGGRCGRWSEVLKAEEGSWHKPYWAGGRSNPFA